MSRYFYHPDQSPAYENEEEGKEYYPYRSRPTTPRSRNPRYRPTTTARLPAKGSQNMGKSKKGSWQNLTSEQPVYRPRPRWLMHPVVQIFIIAVAICLVLVGLLAAGAKLPEPLPLLPALLFLVLALSSIACLLFMLLWMVNWFLTERFLRNQQQSSTETHQDNVAETGQKSKRGASGQPRSAQVPDNLMGSSSSESNEPDYPWSTSDPFVKAKFFLIDRTGASEEELEVSSSEVTQNPEVFTDHLRRVGRNEMERISGNRQGSNKGTINPTALPQQRQVYHDGQ